jgi:hypothetical protein
VGRQLLVAALAALALLTAGCGVVDGLVGSSEAEEEPVLAAVRTYLQAFDEGRARVMAGVSTGPARAYADYRVAVERGDPRGFEDTVVEVVEPLAVTALDAATASVRGTAELRGEEGGLIARLTAFELERDADRWLVRTYDRDGRPLDDFVLRVLLQGAAGDVAATVRLLYSDASAGSLTLPIEVENGTADPIAVEAIEAELESDASGRVHRTGAAPADPIQPAASREVVVTFVKVDDAYRGGILRLHVPGTEQPLELPVPAFGRGAAP